MGVFFKGKIRDKNKDKIRVNLGDTNGCLLGYVVEVWERQRGEAS